MVSTRTCGSGGWIASSSSGSTNNGGGERVFRRLPFRDNRQEKRARFDEGFLGLRRGEE